MNIYTIFSILYSCDKIIKKLKLAYLHRRTIYFNGEQHGSVSLGIFTLLHFRLVICQGYTGLRPGDVIAFFHDTQFH